MLPNCCSNNKAFFFVGFYGLFALQREFVTSKSNPKIEFSCATNCASAAFPDVTSAELFDRVTADQGHRAGDFATEQGQRTFDAGLSSRGQ